MSADSASTEGRKAPPKCAHQPAPYDGPTQAEVLALRQEYLAPALRTYYKDPITIVEGHMQYLWDETGKQYLDGLAGISTVSVGRTDSASAARRRISERRSPPRPDTSFSSIGSST